jgi:hypothetical protein
LKAVKLKYMGLSRASKLRVEDGLVGQDGCAACECLSVYYVTVAMATAFEA